MKLTEKETMLLKDLKNQEKLCVEKYAKYATDACDKNLKNLFKQIGEKEQGHLDTIERMLNGQSVSMPKSKSSSSAASSSKGSGSAKSATSSSGSSGTGSSTKSATSKSTKSGSNALSAGSKTVSTSNSRAQRKDKFLCEDALATEKHVSSTYNTSIFEFTQPKLRNILNHIQKEEQEHGQQIYSYMSQNNMYCS